MTTLSTHDFTPIGAGVNPTGAWNNSLGGAIARTFAQRSSGQTLVGAPSDGGVTASTPSTNGHVGGLSFQAPRWGRMEVLVDQTGGNLNTYGLHIWSTSGQNQGSIAERGRITSAAIELRHYLSGNALIGSDTYARPSTNIWLHFSADPRYGLEFTVKDAANAATLRSFARPVPGAEGGITATAATGDWWSFGFQDSSAPQTAKFMQVRLDDGQGGGTIPTIAASPSSVKTGRTTANISLSISNAVGGEVWYALTTTNVAPADFDAMVKAPLLNNFKVVAANGAQTINVTDLTAGTTYYAWVLGRNATRDRTAVVAAGSFTTDAALPTPAGSSATNVIGEKVVITFNSTGGTVESVSASLPVASPANGAVAQGPLAMVFNASGWPGVWSAEFTPPAGDYDVPVVLASNADNPSVSITGAVAFYLEDPTGTAVPGTDSTAPTLTNPALTSDGPGFITAGADTTEATGTAFAVVTASTTKPTPAQVKAGQIAGGGSAAPWSGSVLVTAIGAFAIRKAHTLSIGAWYAHETHEDGAGNLAAVVTSPVFNISDGTKPVMQGVVSLASLTQTSYTTGCDAATDNIGVTGYQVSLDGGANWIEKNTSRTHSATGRTPGSTDAVQWRAYDAAGLFADPISRDVVLASVPAPVITTQPTSTSVVDGNAASLTAAATVSPGTLSWAWFTRPAGDTGSGSAVSGATSASLDTGALSVSQTGVQFRARARNTIGGVTADTFTNWATITVTAGGGVLPPGPGGTIAGFSPAAFFQMLLMAGES